jgi:Oxidoreductase molybdopterin binding domain
MPEDTLAPLNNLQHKVLARQTRDQKTSLRALAEQYFRTQVAGQVEGTVDAKQRDLACFRNFCVKLYGHDDRRDMSQPHQSWPCGVSCPARAKGSSRKACGSLQSHVRSHFPLLTVMWPRKPRRNRVPEPLRSHGLRAYAKLREALLTPEYGAPLPLVAPGRACVDSVRWVDRLDVVAEEAPTTGEAIARVRLTHGADDMPSR